MKISIIIPTYNNEKTLQECLKSIYSQDISRKDYEVLILDGGSTDRTIEIAKKFPTKIINNPKRSEEPARILGVKKAKGEILCFIDADNVLVGNDFISKFNNAFKDKEIFFADTLYWGYRENDPIKVKYQALIGGDDPLATYLGLYSKWCYFTNDWTGFPYISKSLDNYFKVSLKDLRKVPAMGSNGFFIRTKIARMFVKNTFIHSDLIYDLVNNGYNCFAKINANIIHDQQTFFKNKIRRIKRRTNNEVKIRYNYDVNNKKIILLLIRSILLFPVIYDVLKGFIRKPTISWIFHFPALYGLLIIHFYYAIKNMLKLK